MACNISGFTPNQKPYIHVVSKVEPYLGTVSHTCMLQFSCTQFFIGFQQKASVSS